MSENPSRGPGPGEPDPKSASTAETTTSSLRPTSYVLVSSVGEYDSADDDDDLFDQPATGDAPPSPVPESAARPRFYFVLPTLAALDFLLAAVVGYTLISQDNPENGDGGDANGAGNTRLVTALLACALLRDSAMAIIGFSKAMPNLGITVAALSLTSLLWVTSILNLLFQVRGNGPGQSESQASTTIQLLINPLLQSQTTAHVAVRRKAAHGIFDWAPSYRQKPTLALLCSLQLFTTVAQWISYIAIVGVRVPPGGNPVRAQRWMQALAQGDIDTRGLRVRSIYDLRAEFEDGEADVEALSRPLSPMNARSPGSDLESDASDVEEASKQLCNSSHEEQQTEDEEQQTEEEGDDTAESGPVEIPTSSILRRREASASSLRVNAPSGLPPSESTPLSLRLRPQTAPTRLGDLSFPALANRGDDGRDDLDPDDICDISTDRNVSRHFSRARLALAADPERRRSAGPAWSLLASSRRADDDVSHGASTEPAEDGAPAASDADESSDALLDRPRRRPRTSLSRLAALLPGSAARERRRTQSLLSDPAPK